jgi:hypothetical protein
MFAAVFGCFDDARPADGGHGRDENDDGPSHDGGLDERWPLNCEAWQYAHCVLRLSDSGPRASGDPKDISSFAAQAKDYRGRVLRHINGPRMRFAVRTLISAT